MTTKQKWIIDTDPGCDDLMAILYLLNKPNIEVLMISTSDGNVSINKTTQNARKIIQWSGKKIPIYRGAEKPIIKTFSNEESYFFSDGLGDIDEIRDFQPDEIQVEKESSILKMIELTETYPNEINLLVIGPLTNLAIASMLHPDICSRFKKIYMMGGSLTAKGNDNVCMGEFNFNSDFIATKITFNNFKNIIITPWEPVEKIRINSEYIENVEKRLVCSNKEYNKNIHRLSKLIVDKFTKEKKGIHMCDLYCVMSAFDNNCVKKFSLCNVDVMIDSMVNFGMLLIKNRKIINDDFHNFKEKKKEGIHSHSDYHLVIENFNFDKVMEEFEFVFREQS